MEQPVIHIPAYERIANVCDRWVPVETHGFEHFFQNVWPGLKDARGLADHFAGRMDLFGSDLGGGQKPVWRFYTQVGQSWVIKFQFFTF